MELLGTSEWASGQLGNHWEWENQGNHWEEGERASVTIMAARQLLKTMDISIVWHCVSPSHASKVCWALASSSSKGPFMGDYSRPAVGDIPVNHISTSFSSHKRTSIPIIPPWRKPDLSLSLGTHLLLFSATHACHLSLLLDAQWYFCLFHVHSQGPLFLLMKTH